MLEWMDYVQPAQLLCHVMVDICRLEIMVGDAL